MKPREKIIQVLEEQLLPCHTNYISERVGFPAFVLLRQLEREGVVRCTKTIRNYTWNLKTKEEL